MAKAPKPKGQAPKRKPAAKPAAKQGDGDGPLAVVAALMTPDVVTAHPDDTLRAVARRMNRHRVGCVVVIEQERLLGIVSERDVLKAVAAGKAPARTKAESLMSQPVLCAPPETAVDQAARIMAERGIKRLPILGPDGRLQGIVTATDLVAALPAYRELLAKSAQKASAKGPGKVQGGPQPWTFI